MGLNVCQCDISSIWDAGFPKSPLIHDVAEWNTKNTTNHEVHNVVFVVLPGVPVFK